MNKEARDITFENSAFSLTIHWNPEVVMTQACILIACLAAYILLPQGPLHTLSMVLLIIDAVSLVLGLFMKRKESDNSNKKEKNQRKGRSQQNSEDGTPPATTEHSTTGHCSTRMEENREIRNKLSVATPRPGAHRITAPAPSTQPVAESEPNAAPVIPADEQSPVDNIPEEVRAAFTDFFDFDLDDE